MISSVSGNHTTNAKKLAFGRALTENELDVYQSGMAKIKNFMQIPDAVNCCQLTTPNNSALILPDSYVPGKTLNSDEAMQLVDLMRVMNGINVIQALPRTQISDYNKSPFSGSPFEMGDQLISLKKLNAPDLQTAFAQFKALPENSDIKIKYNVFKQDNPHLERFGMLEGLKKEYGTDYWPHWQGEKSELDKNLFNYDDTLEIPNANRQRQNEIKAAYSDEIDFYQFKQFAGKQQHLETKQKYNEKGMKFFGDCLIGFNHRDEWAFKHAFEPGKSLGAMDNIYKDSEMALKEALTKLGSNDRYQINEDKKSAKVYRDWGTSCLDNSKLYNADGTLGAAGRVQKLKNDVFFTDYDGARIDAGWQLSHPITSTNNPIISQNQEYLGTKMLKIMEMSLNEQEAKGHKISAEDINIENLGGPGEAVLLTKNKYPHIHHSRYQGNDWGRMAFYNSSRSGNDHEFTNAGYKQSGVSFGPDGCHDDCSSIEISETKRLEQAKLLASDMKIEDNSVAESAEQFRNAKNAEAQAARNNFITAPNAIGDARRINNPENSGDKNNWITNILDLGSNPEETFFKNLSEGKGLNKPKSLAIAIKVKMGENAATKPILEFLETAGKILRQTGPNTIAEATRLEQLDPIKLGERLLKHI